MKLAISGQEVSLTSDNGIDTYVFSADTDFTADWIVDRSVDKYSIYIAWENLDDEGTFSLKIAVDDSNYDVQNDTTNVAITKAIDNTDGYYNIVNQLAAVGRHRIDYTAGDVTEGNITLIVKGAI
jgi:DNA-binding sugar fermentation-stimulating protein